MLFPPQKERRTPRKFPRDRPGGARARDNARQRDRIEHSMGPFTPFDDLEENPKSPAKTPYSRLTLPNGMSKVP